MKNLYQAFHQLSTSITKARLPHNSAGKLMTHKVPLAKSSQSLGEVKQSLSDHPQEWETINYIYVLSKSGRLIGTFSIDQVFRLQPDTLVKDIMIRQLVWSKPATDQERVAQLALKHNLKAIPLVDDHKRLVGVVPSDSILSILSQEHHEDILHMAGIVPHTSHSHQFHEVSIVHSVISRTPWLIVGLMGGLFMAHVIGGFEHVLSQNLVLAAFIPLIVYLANAVGVQSQTLFIRDMALHTTFSRFRYALRQLITASLIGLVCSILLITLTSIIWTGSGVGIIIGISAFTAIMAASTLALLVPMLLIRLNIDPAIGSGPFATIIQDLMSVTIYFATATLLL